MAIDPRMGALRESLRGYVDSAIAGKLRGIDANGNPVDFTRVLQSYMSNGGAGDVMGIGKQAYDQALRRLGADGPRILAAMKAMYDDSALMQFGRQYGLDPAGKTPEQFNEELAKKGFVNADARGGASPYFTELNDPNSPENQARTAEAARIAEENQQKAWRTGVQAKLKAYADRMLTYDPKDPTALAIANNAVGGANSMNRAAGVGSGRGLGALNVASLATEAATRYQMAREQAGIGALNNLGGFADSAMRSAEQRRQFDENLDFNIGQYNAGLGAQNNAADREQNQGAWGLGGGLLGGVVGAIPGIVSGNPVMAGMGAQAGSQIGAGFGGAAGGLSTPAYRAPAYRRGGGRSYNM